MKFAFVVLLFVFASFVVAKDKGCPLAESGCPYYAKAVEGSPEKSPCPAVDCPYYKKHKNAGDVVDLLFEEDHKCPLAEKCGFFKALQKGEVDKIDWTTSNCPLKEKCPYYKKIKEHPEKHEACPILSKCPHAAKVHEQYKDSEHPHPDYEGEASKCPHLQKQKAKKSEERDEL
ncbi:hypothetical protein HK098_003747 [Nowakowskiella sp. JEL0407]|nr:hypothetical protein HK098_003747 [Nowakowskiella sp. JEL0407]